MVLRHAAGIPVTSAIHAVPVLNAPHSHSVHAAPMESPAIMG